MRFGSMYFLMNKRNSCTSRISENWEQLGDSMQTVSDSFWGCCCFIFRVPAKSGNFKQSAVFCNVWRKPPVVFSNNLHNETKTEHGQNLSRLVKTEILFCFETVAVQYSETKHKLNTNSRVRLVKFRLSTKCTYVVSFVRLHYQYSYYTHCHSNLLLNCEKTNASRNILFSHMKTKTVSDILFKF